MFFESAAYVVDALHSLGRPSRCGDVGRACRTTARTAIRHLIEMEENGLVVGVRQGSRRHRYWSLTARGEAFRQALQVQPEPLADGAHIEVAVVTLRQTA